MNVLQANAEKSNRLQHCDGLNHQFPLRILQCSELVVGVLRQLLQWLTVSQY